MSALNGLLDGLAEPIETEGGISLGAGEIGDEIERVSKNGATNWLSHEDPAHADYPLVQPELPSTLPQGFVAPSGPFTPTNIYHYDNDTLDGYADTIRSYRSSSLPSTVRSRRREYACP